MSPFALIATLIGMMQWCASFPFYRKITGEKSNEYTAKWIKGYIARDFTERNRGEDLAVGLRKLPGCCSPLGFPFRVSGSEG